MSTVKKRPWFSDQAIESLLKANNIVFLLAVLLNFLSSWLMFPALLFWIFTTVCLAQRDFSAKKVSFATIAYIVLTVLLSVFTMYTLIYSLAN